MNPIVEEMLMHDISDEAAEDILMHYGMPRRSGRYPYGSGDNPYQHGHDFLARVEELRKQGFTYTDENGKKYTGDTAIAKSMGLSTTNFRTEIGIAKDERRMYDVARAKSLAKDGLGPTEIGRVMGVNESTVRSLLDPNREARMNQAQKTADSLKEILKEHKMVDIGSGAELELGVSPERLKQAVYLLEREGYPVYKGGIPQVTNPGQQTNQKILCVPGTQHKEIYEFDKIASVKEYTSHDGGDTFTKFVYPSSMDSKRLMVRYKEDGGELKDGIVELRRGVNDLSLGDARFSQVRILVDGKKYIKGMAVYGDDKDFPPGVDVIFNTNKDKSKAKLEVLKDIKNDPENPFGSLIKPGGQSYYTDKNGNKQLSLINKRSDEGDWSEWADALPSQFLGKQSLTLAKKQLNLARADRQAEYESICALTNPTIKKHLLQKFADECDAAAVHLKAAALPGQKYHVIIPVNSLKDTEVYAPGYENGSKLALVRYPHGGTFEIPILTVNNKNAAAKKIIPNDVMDAVCINKKVADRLSGADFDGDTVMCIPTHNGKVKITNQKELEGLKGFDPKFSYAYSDADIASGKAKLMSKKGTQREMGEISNLITDMTLAGAKPAELAAATRHSMVVIDAEKHKLNYKQSEIDNNIKALKQKYQIKEDGGYGGAATILSRAKGQTTVDKRQGTPKVNMKGKEWYDPTRPEGSLIYKTADDIEYTYTKTYKRTGQTVEVTGRRGQKSVKMLETDDAYTLVSKAKHPMEIVYADHANAMKAMANKARLEMMTTGNLRYDKQAKETYREEYNSLMGKLNNALLNAPKQRAAERRANITVQAKLANDPTMSKEDLRKAGQQAITASRSSVGAASRKDRNINITDREWEAIQAGAISENKLQKILNNADVDRLRELATPKQTKTLSQAQISRVKALSATHTIAEIAAITGKSPSTISKYLKGGN